MSNAPKLAADKMMIVPAMRNVTLPLRNAFPFATKDLVHREPLVMLGTTKNTAHAHHLCRVMDLPFVLRVSWLCK
jgi:hypothetical protein